MRYELNLFRCETQSNAFDYNCLDTVILHFYYICDAVCYIMLLSRLVAKDDQIFIIHLLNWKI